MAVSPRPSSKPWLEGLFHVSLSPAPTNSHLTSAHCGAQRLSSPYSRAFCEALLQPRPSPLFYFPGLVPSFLAAFAKPLFFRNFDWRPLQFLWLTCASPSSAPLLLASEGLFFFFLPHRSFLVLRHRSCLDFTFFPFLLRICSPAKRAKPPSSATPRRYDAPTV